MKYWEVDHGRTLVPVLHRYRRSRRIIRTVRDDGGAVRRRRAGRHHRPPGRRSDAAQPGAGGHRCECGGAGGTIGTARVAQAKPDGYTILLGHVGQATSVSLYKSLTYDPVEGFETIGLITDVPMTMVGKPDLAPKDLKKLDRLHPGKPRSQLNFAHSGLGSVAHLCGLMFMSATGTKMAFIPYKGGGEVAKIAGRPDRRLLRAGNGHDRHIQAGKIKPYAVTTKRRVATLPDVPTTAEAGFPEIGITTWYGL